MRSEPRHSHLVRRTHTSIGSFRRTTRLLLIGWVILSVVAIAYVVRQSLWDNRLAFNQAAGELANAVTDRALIAETALEGFSAFVVALPRFDHATAAGYARTLSARYPFLYKFEVAQQIDHTERTDLERKLSVIYPDFKGKNRNFPEIGQERWHDPWFSVGNSSRHHWLPF